MQMRKSCIETQIYELNRRRARAKAQMVLGAWRNQGPKCARVLSKHNKQLYCLKWTSPVPPDLPLNVHPATIRASAVDTPFGAV